MSKLDGSPDELTYGQALCAIVERTPWQSQEIQAEVLYAVQAEHDLLPEETADPAATTGDPRDLTLKNQDEEIAALKAKLAERAGSETAKTDAGAEPQVVAGPDGPVAKTATKSTAKTATKAGRH